MAGTLRFPEHEVGSGRSGQMRSIVLSMVIFAGCSADDSARQGEASTSMPELSRLADSIASRGFTCSNVAQMAPLSAETLPELRALVAARVGNEEKLHDLVEGREKNCAHVSHAYPTSDEYGTIESSITGTYAVQFVPEASGSSGVTGGIFRDSGSSDWMCNDKKPETPADYIAEYRLSGASANRPKIRVRGKNVWASCYVQSSNASRIYSDDTIRMCVGFWHVFLCGAVAPLPRETAVWLGQ